LRASRLKHFEQLLRGRAFSSPNWSKAILLDDDEREEMRADGQHTSRVLATCDEAIFPRGLSVTVNVYHLDSASDLPDLFDLFDNPLSARSNTDKMSVYAANYEELDGLDRGFLAKVARGIDYYLRDVSEAQSPLLLHVNREHGLYFEKPDSRTFALWLYQWREARHSWMFSKPGIIAEAYSDWRAFPVVAGEFWAQVFNESNPDPNDDTRELAATLKDWARKQPTVKQDKFRARARKFWERYKRQAAQVAA